MESLLEWRVELAERDDGFCWSLHVVVEEGERSKDGGNLTLDFV